MTGGHPDLGMTLSGSHISHVGVVVQRPCPNGGQVSFKILIFLKRAFFALANRSYNY